jgi:hypothetical protein
MNESKMYLGIFLLACGAVTCAKGNSIQVYIGMGLLALGVYFIVTRRK